jgi:hypothetical protein
MAVRLCPSRFQIFWNPVVGVTRSIGQNLFFNYSGENLDGSNGMLARYVGNVLRKA